MDGAAKILRRYVGTTILVSVLLLIINFVMLGAWIFKGMNEGGSPSGVAQSVSESLQPAGGVYSLRPEAQKLLQDSRAWAMLLDGSGEVVWGYDLPEQLPRNYSLNDVAKFSRNYLLDYPVYVWEHSDGLVVAGFPQNQTAKYQFSFPVAWVSDLPFRIAVWAIGNLALALLVSLWIGSRLFRSIRPLVRGIYALADEQPAYVEPKGVLSSLAASINHTSALLEHKNASLKARDEARSNWIAGISHDIRTPLSMVLGYACELEVDEDAAPDRRRKAGIIRQQGEKLRSLVLDLNLVSMLEYEMQPLQTKPVRLSVLARRVASEFLNNGLDPKYVLELDVPDERLKVIADEKLLLRAITNLVQNSIDHNPQGCRILLQIASSPDPDRNECHFVVSDNGGGIPHSEFRDLVELPYASTRKRPVGSGRGLGLPMVARIAKAHRGRLLLTGDAGEGVRAAIVLPAESSRNQTGRNS